MTEKERIDLLRKRIVVALADDEEFLEEIYLYVSYSPNEQRSEHGSRYEFTRHTLSYRLSEIVEILHLLESAGLVSWRRVKEFPESAGITANMYRLTEEGEAYCEEVVKSGVTQLFL